ncbi:7-carboxy-7-deazaguanine synthase [subsurface metagenome]
MFEKDSEGYLSEVFSSIQGEGGTVRGSCFGKRQIFLRFSGCNLAEGNTGYIGCFWCDSLNAQELKTQYFKYEENPGSQKLINSNNPVGIAEIIRIIKKLITRDLHSISFTGGEPLYQLDFILNLSKALKGTRIEYPLYLETNGTIILDNSQLKQIATSFKYCCCDIKDLSSKVALPDPWKSLVITELDFIRNMVKYGTETFAKLVVTSETQLQDIRWISKELSKITYADGQVVGLAIQPVYLESKELKDNYSISTSHLNNIFYTAAEFLPSESLTLSIQAHKYLKLL